MPQIPLATIENLVAIALAEIKLCNDKQTSTKFLLNHNMSIYEICLISLKLFLKIKCYYIVLNG